MPGQAAPEPSETGKLLAQSASTKSLSSLPHDPAALPPVAPQPGLAPSHSNRSLAESTSANARRQAPEAAATLAPAEPSTAHRVAESSSLYHASGAPSAVPVRSPAPQQPGAGPAAPQDVPPPAPDVRRTIPTGDDGLQAPAASGEVSRATAGNGSRADKHRAGLAHLSVPGTSPPVKGMAAVDGAKAEAGTARGSEAATTPREDDGTAASKMARSRGQSNAGVPSSKEEGPGWRGEEEGGSQTTPVTGAASKAKVRTVAMWCCVRRRGKEV